MEDNIVTLTAADLESKKIGELVEAARELGIGSSGNSSMRTFKI